MFTAIEVCVRSCDVTQDALQQPYLNLCNAALTAGVRLTHVPSTATAQIDAFAANGSVTTTQVPWGWLPNRWRRRNLRLRWEPQAGLVYLMGADGTDRCPVVEVPTAAKALIQPGVSVRNHSGAVNRLMRLSELSVAYERP